MAQSMHVFKVTGITPVIQHNPMGMAMLGNAPGIKKIPTPEEEAKRAEYRNEDGVLYLPAIMFRAALIRGCVGRRIGKMGASTRIQAAVFNAETECPLVHAKTSKPIKTYEILTVRAVVQGNGVLRSRPVIKDWTTKVAFEIDEEFVTPEAVEEIFNISGRMAGVGDWRPQKKGPYGRFTATLS